MRKPMMAGNWKMNKSVSEALALARRIDALVGSSTAVEQVLCPPFVCLHPLSTMTTARAFCTRRARLPLAGERRLHRRDQPADAARTRRIRDHRTQRAPAAVRRERRNRQQEEPRRAGARTDPDRLRRRKPRTERAGRDRRDHQSTGARRAGWHERRAGRIPGDRLRADLGHRHGPGRNRRDGRRNLRAGTRHPARVARASCCRHDPHPLRRQHKTGQHPFHHGEAGYRRRAHRRGVA